MAVAKKATTRKVKAKAKAKVKAKPRKKRRKAAPKPAPRVGVSPAAYGEHAGMTRQAVRHLMDQGQLSKSVWKEGRLWKINIEQADQERAANVGLRRNVPAEEQVPATAPKAAIPSAEPSVVEFDMTLVEAKTRTEISKGGIEELRLLELQGQLIRADVVERERFNLGRLIRDAILAVPAIVGPEVASMTDAKEVTIMLERELVRALSDLSDQQLGGVA